MIAKEYADFSWQQAEQLLSIDSPSGFTDYAALEREEKLQRVLLQVRRKYGANSILIGKNFKPGATARERNQQIGGHKA